VTGDQLIKWSAVAVVVAVAAIAAVVSYSHALALVEAHGETGTVAHLVPLTVDGLIYASSMALLSSARQRRSAPTLAYGLLALGLVPPWPQTWPTAWPTAQQAPPLPLGQRYRSWAATSCS
jgi:hypothetical protein